MIELDHVEVRVDQFGAAPATLLQDITCRISERRVALVGANGSGKSTFLKLLNGLMLPSAGRVIVDGVDTRQDAKVARSQVGYVFTDPLAQLVMSTPLSDIELSLRRTIRDRRERTRAAQQLLDERGLGHLANRSIYDLSGGERQLVALTTVLATAPSIVVADEPTTLLDLKNRELLRAALWDLDAQVLVSTHDLELAAEADRVLIIDSGRVVGDGSPAEQISRYRALMSEQLAQQ